MKNNFYKTALFMLSIIGYNSCGESIPTISHSVPIKIIIAADASLSIVDTMQSKGIKDLFTEELLIRMNNSPLIRRDSMKVEYMMLGNTSLKPTNDFDLFLDKINDVSSYTDSDIDKQLAQLIKLSNDSTIVVFYSDFIAESKLNEADLYRSLKHELKADVKMGCYGNKFYRLELGPLEMLEDLPGLDETLYAKVSNGASTVIQLATPFKFQNCSPLQNETIRIRESDDNDVKFAYLMNLNVDKKDTIKYEAGLYSSGDKINATIEIKKVADVADEKNLFSLDDDKQNFLKRYSHVIMCTVPYSSLYNNSKIQPIELAIYHTQTWNTSFTNCAKDNPLISPLLNSLYSKALPEELKNPTMKTIVYKPLEIVSN